MPRATRKTVVKRIAADYAEMILQYGQHLESGGASYNAIHTENELRKPNPLVLNFGGGTNSTALLLAMYEREIFPDLIIFANTGGERPYTYEHVAEMSTWCAAHGMPEIVTVQRSGATLEEHCLFHGNLPAKVYGRAECSDRWKRRPVEVFISSWQPAMDIWAKGERVQKLLGYEYGEENRQAKTYAAMKTDKKYQLLTPLIDWRINRQDCIDLIAKHGIKQPKKSACFFCPVNKKHEILELKETYPKLMQRALDMEAKALPNLRRIKGLGFRWSWNELVNSANETGDYDEVAACPVCYDG